jgi:HPt (histidine-containing phosphotransfer) domain-containing protein
MNAHLVKPINPPLLYATISKWTESRPKVSPELSIDKKTVSNFAVPVLEGIDTELGLIYHGGDVGLYQKVLAKFSKNQATIISQIKKDCNNVDIDEAKRLAHTLKGLAGSVGATKLQQLAFDLETAVKMQQQEQVHSLIPMLDEELNKVVNTIDRAVWRTESASSAIIKDNANDAEIYSDLELLLEKLISFDGDADSYLEAIISKCSEQSLIPPLQSLLDQISDYNFEIATDELKALLLTKRA